MTIAVSGELTNVVCHGARDLRVVSQAHHLYLAQANGLLYLQEKRPLSAPKPGEVTVAIHSTGLCGSDGECLCLRALSKRP